MSATFSLFDGQIIQSDKKENINDVLGLLPNNTNKLISPKDIRDSFLTAWSSSVFKITRNSNNDEYIGIDSYNPEYRDIKNKILIGKRSYKSLDVMSTYLLNSDTDIFFYNTKDDTVDQNSTKISILAGTNSGLFNNAPYIESFKDYNKINLNIINSGTDSNINIYSISDRIYINGIGFPTISENELASDNDILKYKGTYPNGYLQWINNDDVNSQFDFINTNLVPLTLGGVTAGSNFEENSNNGDNWTIKEVLRKILYPHVKPSLYISVNNNSTNSKFAEVGTTNSISLSYSIIGYPRNESEYISNYQIKNETDNIILLTHSSIEQLPGFVESGIYSTISIYTDVPNSFFTFSLTVFDGTTYSVSDNIEFISPYFIHIDQQNYEFTNSDLSTLANISTKIIKPKEDYIDVEFNSENEYLYFCYPYSYGDISKIKDPNGFIIHDSSDLHNSCFTYSNTQISTSNYYGTYRIYKTINRVTNDNSEKFKFYF